MSSILSGTFDQDLTLDQARCWVSVAIFSYAQRVDKNRSAWPVPWDDTNKPFVNSFANTIRSQEFELQNIISNFYIREAREKIIELVSRLFDCNVVQADAPKLGYENLVFTTGQKDEPLIQICYYGRK